MRKVLILKVLVFLQCAFISLAGKAYIPCVEAAEILVKPGDSIQAAIQAATSGEAITLEEGTYVENIDYLGKAITIRSTDPNDPDVVAATIIDGNQVASVVTFESGEGSRSVLSGITIQNGRGSYGLGGGIYCGDYCYPKIDRCIITANTAEWGGGICCDNSRPDISHCIIQGNQAQFGGGIKCYIASKPTITDCLITENTVTDDGGGICCWESSPRITSCIITSNTAEWGGGIACEDDSSMIISHCTIQGNQAQSGGGIECFDSSNSTITDCLITENTATDDGGGVFCYISSSIITSCTITGNTAEWGGGIVCVSSSPEIINCVFWGNSATLGGGIKCSSQSWPHLINCTLSDNSAYGYIAHGGGLFADTSSVFISNCILWNNIPEQIYKDTACTITAAYSDIQGGYSGAGNMNDDPSFVNPAAGDYHIRSDSPCIDAATSLEAPVDDRDGHPRPLGAGYDMGAYEHIGDLDMMTMDINLNAGWNMVSLPVKPEDRRGTALFPGAKAIFEFTIKYVLLDPDQSLEFGKGYWVHVSEARTYPITGLPVSHCIIPAKRGWSMIGSCSYPSSSLSVDEGTIKEVLGFNGQLVSYGSGGTIAPLECGKGFWVNLSDQANLRIDRNN